MARIGADVVIVGAGHNGLVAAVMLARGAEGHGAGGEVLGRRGGEDGVSVRQGAASSAPRPGAYLLGVMQPELIAKLGGDVRVDPAGSALLPADDRPTVPAVRLRPRRDAAAVRRVLLRGGLDGERGDEPRDRADPRRPRARVAGGAAVDGGDGRAVRPPGAARRVSSTLVARPVEEYLARFGFRSELLLAMYAVTDGFSGLSAGFGTPGTGMNFLVHNMCRLPGADGTWMIVRGRDGERDARAGAAGDGGGRGIRDRRAVERIETHGGRGERRACWTTAREVRGEGGDQQRRSVPHAGAGRGRSSSRRRSTRGSTGSGGTGTTMKVNLALDRLPTFTCLPENRGQHNATIHLLPQEPDVIGEVRRGFERVQAGELAEFPTIEWYIHTQADPSLQDERGRHNSAFFVQWVPYELSGGTTWETEEERYVEHLLGIAERFAPGIRASVVGRVRADAAEDRAALRDHGRAHPSRGQHVRVRPADALRDAGGGAVLVQRGLSPGGIGDRVGRAQCGDEGDEGYGCGDVKSGAVYSFCFV